MTESLLTLLIYLAIIVWLLVIIASIQKRKTKKKDGKEPSSKNPKKQIILDKINNLENEESNLQLDHVKQLISFHKIDEAEEKLNEFMLHYKEFNNLKTDLTNINDKLGSLTNKLADGDINSEAYTKASDTLEQKKKNVEEKMWKLRNTLFKDSYEKPF